MTTSVLSSTSPKTIQNSGMLDSLDGESAKGEVLSSQVAHLNNRSILWVQL